MYVAQFHDHNNHIHFAHEVCEMICGWAKLFQLKVLLKSGWVVALKVKASLIMELIMLGAK